MINPTLNDVRETLTALEDTIIRALIERTQYKTNDKAYIAGGISIKGFEGSFFDFLFRGIEKTHALAGRYDSFDEIPFNKGNPDSLAKREYGESPIVDVNINMNKEIRQAYFDSLSLFCEKGDDIHYGSTVIRDINALQAISKRVHYGTLVMELKYQEDKECYTELAKAKDKQSIIDKLTNTEVENQILDRVKIKAEKGGLDPKVTASFYKERIIPLTKDIEVEYLFRRIR